MRVLLVQPDYKRSADSGQELKAGLLPARSLLELAAGLEARGHEVTVLDPLTALAITGDDTALDMVPALEALMKEENYDAVGIAVYTATRKEAHELAATAKRRSRKTPVIAGGPHPARLAQSLLRGWKEIDYICLGAAEKSLPALLDRISQGGRPAFRIPGLAFRAGPRFVRQTGKPMFNVDLKELPPPSYDRYLDRLVEGGVGRAYVMSARGCTYWCNFCSNLWKKVLLADPEAVAKEITLLVQEAGAKQVIIYDDCFGMRPDHARAVLEAVIRSGVEVELQAITRLDLVSEDWLSLFREAGGRDILVGLETGSSRLRRKMNKHIRDDDICRGSELIRKMGFRLGVFVMFGFPGERDEDVEATFRLLEKLDPDQVMSTVFDLKPGDMLYEFTTTAEILTPENWLDEEKRFINDLEPEETETAVARAVAFDRAFTREMLMPEHDPADFLAGISKESLEPLIKREMNVF